MENTPVPLTLLCVCIALAGCSSQSRVTKTSAKPPSTRLVPFTEPLHGVNIIDNYRWLEGTTPEVAAWTDAENRYTRTVLDQLPGRQVLEDRLGSLMQTGSVTPPIARGNRYFFSGATAAQSQPHVYWREGYRGPFDVARGGADKVLIDPERLDPARPTALAWFTPSADGKLLAYGTYHTGDTSPTLHLLDVDTAKPLPLEIPNVPDAIQWLPDRSGFFYQSDDEHGRRGLLHRMGGSARADVLVYQQAAPASMQNLPDNWGPFGTLSADGHWMVLGHWEDPASNDLWLANFDDVRKTGKLVAHVVSVGVAGQASGTVVGSTLFLQTTKGAPKGRVIAVGVGDPAQARWRDVVKERADAVIEHVSFGRGRIAVTYGKNAASFIEVFDLGGTSQGTVKLPGIGLASLTAVEDRTETFLTFTSINYPPTIFRLELTDLATAPELWMAPEMAGRPSDVQVEQVWYPSRDGTKISMFLAHKVGLARKGETPTLMPGFGAFGVSVTPSFSPTYFQWFDAGGLLALPNVRGGGEYGEAWHAAGMLDKKQTAFDDFIAAAEWLVANKYTNPQRLAIYGGAHGALMTGAVLTQRPDLCRVAILSMPVLDMLRYEPFLAGREWVQEYGSAGNAEQSKWLLAYSPYQHVKAGTMYPAVLLIADEDDTDVHPMHARKMAAALQAATASDPADHPILLRVDPARGQDPQATLNLQLERVVDQRIFIMWQFGML